MTTKTQTQYQHLEPRPGSNYRQLFLKGRRIRAAVVDEAIHSYFFGVRYGVLAPRSSGKENHLTM
jgi:hypothetical protein